MSAAQAQQNEGGERRIGGVTEIRPRVLEKIATQAAANVSGVARSRSGLNPFSSDDADKAPSIDASAQMEGRSARLRLQFDIEFPRPVQRTVADVRTRVRKELSEFAGVELDRVDVVVGSLVVAPSRRKRVQ